MEYIVPVIFLMCTLITACCGECKPTFVPPASEYNPGESFTAQCPIQGDCLALGVIAFQRWYNDGWHTALEMDPSPTYFTLAHGYTLEGRSTAVESLNIYFLSIQSSTLQDSGPWRCSVIDGANNVFPSDESLFNVTSSNLQQRDVFITRLETDDIVFTVPNTYTCSVMGVYPQDVDVIWTIGSRLAEGNTEVTNNEYIYNIESKAQISIEDVSDQKIECFVEKRDGVKWNVSNEWIVPSNVRTPAHVESSSTSHQDIDIKFTAECIASGDEVNITWTIADEPWNAVYFKETQSITNGNFEFGQTQALKSILTLNDQESCKERNKNAGVFKCIASGLAGTRDTDTHDIKQCDEGSNVVAIVCGSIAIVLVVGIGVGVGVYFVFFKKKEL